MKKIAVLLHGNGVYDGTEIHEAVLSLLAIAENGGKTVCFAPNIDQHHVINHTTGEEMNESRNILVESARIARGEIIDIKDLKISEMAGLVMPGGFGTAKNLTKWAFEGPEGNINKDVARVINEFITQKKPIVGLCMSPTTIAKALSNEKLSAKLTVGTTSEKSPYEIGAISEGMKSLGHVAEMKSITEISYDENSNIITAPCYMMEATLLEVRNNIKQAVDKMFELI
ncbi:MAG: isoprenoid biosynthesis glyoxalase ElbB [Bacteroidota bacterium]